MVWNHRAPNHQPLSWVEYSSKSNPSDKDMFKIKLGGGYSHILLEVPPQKLGKMNPILTVRHIFQMGWNQPPTSKLFNHQGLDAVQI